MYNNTTNIDPNSFVFDEKFHHGNEYFRFVKSKQGKIFGMCLFTPRPEDRRQVYREEDRTLTFMYPATWISIWNIHRDGRCSYHMSQMTDDQDGVAHRLHILN